MPHVALLLIPGVPLLAIGQLWAIGVMRSRTPRRAGTSLFQQASFRSSWNPRTFFFGSLGVRTSAVLFAGALCGWLLAVTAFPSSTNGGPDGQSTACAYTLESHGTTTCVSRAAYLRAGAAKQRLGAGVLLAFYCVQCGAALGGRAGAPQDDLPLRTGLAG